MVVGSGGAAVVEGGFSAFVVDGSGASLPVDVGAVSPVAVVDASGAPPVVEGALPPVEGEPASVPVFVSSSALNSPKSVVWVAGASGGGVSGGAGMLERPQAAADVAVPVAVWLAVPVPDAVPVPVADAVTPVWETPVPVPVMVSSGAENSPSSVVCVAGASGGGFSGGAGMLAHAAAELETTLLDTPVVEAGLVLD